MTAQVESFPFRGQYFFGRHGTRCPPGFVEIQVGDRALLKHEALPSALARANGWTGILAGHVFDSANSHWNIADILRNLLSGTAQDILVRTGRLAGRWALIVLGDDTELALGDACGTMPITWVRRDDKINFAASTLLLDRCLTALPPNKNVEAMNFRSLQSQSYSGIVLPGGLTEFAGVRVLLPNHYLDLKNRQEVRYHPVARYPQMHAAELAPRIATLFKNIVESASLRAPLAIATTAGFDSRILAAAVSQVPGLAEKTEIFTCQDGECAPGHFDIVTSRKIAEMIGSRHKEFARQTVGNDTLQLTRKSEWTINPRFEEWTQARARDSGVPRIVLAGLCGETGRAHFRWEGCEYLTASQLCDCGALRSLRSEPYFHEELNPWLSTAARASSATGIHRLDLFYWEMRCGRWDGALMNTLNSLSDWVSIYSCRDLLDLMHSVREDERGKPRQILYREVIAQLNPELLQIPYNPFPIRHSARVWIRRVFHSAWAKPAKKLGLYKAIQALRS